MRRHSAKAITAISGMPIPRPTPSPILVECFLGAGLGVGLEVGVAGTAEMEAEADVLLLEVITAELDTGTRGVLVAVESEAEITVLGTPGVRVKTSL